MTNNGGLPSWVEETTPSGVKLATNNNTELKASIKMPFDFTLYYPSPYYKCKRIKKAYKYDGGFAYEPIWTV